MTIARQFRLEQRPDGRPDADCWSFDTATLPDLAHGEVLVRVDYLSLDPAMRGWMDDHASYAPPVEIGAVMRALGVGEVVESRADGFSAGDAVSGVLGVQDHAVVHANALHRIELSLAPPERWLGALGMTGMTAWFGLLDVGKPTTGDTVLVSAASGAVGSVVAQIAARHGCRVVGIAGGEKKCAYLVDELGLDAAIDYKSEKESLRAAVRRTCPDGVDVYFDNVGGETLDAALANLAMRARIVICGAISQYNTRGGAPGPSNYLALLVKRSRMEGMLVSDYADRFGEAVPTLAAWLADGTVKTREHVVEGFETFPDTFLMLFDGANHGKLVLKVGH